MTANSDFKGDGYEDILVGAPGATVSGKKGAGLLTVQYGSSKGIGTSNAARSSQSTSGVAGAAETGDGFGRSVATGDLDGDGYDDAVVGIPGEDIGTLTDPNGDGRFGLPAAAPGENTGDGHIRVLSAGAGGVTAAGSWTYNAASLGAPAVDALFGGAVDE